MKQILATKTPSPAIKQIKVETAQFKLNNPNTVQTLQHIAAFEDAANIGLFGDITQGHAAVETVGVVLLAYECDTLAAAETRFHTHNTVYRLQHEADRNSNVQLFAVLSGGQVLEYKANYGWGIAQVSKLIRERIAVNSVPIQDFVSVSVPESQNTQSASLAMPSTETVAVEAPDWAHVLMNKLAKLPEASSLRVFGSVATLSKDPADLDIAVVCETDDWNDAQAECADLLFDLLNIKENGWLGELLDLYVCLTDATYVYSEDVGDWIPVHDGAQLAKDVRKLGKHLPQPQTAAITNKMPKRRRLKNDPEHRKDRLEYKKEMKNPTVKRKVALKRKLYVKRNKPKLQRKAETYRKWRSRQNF